MKTLLTQVLATVVGAAVMLGLGFAVQRALYVNHELTIPAVRLTLPRSWVTAELGGQPAGSEVTQYVPAGKTAPTLQVIPGGPVTKSVTIDALIKDLVKSGSTAGASLTQAKTYGSMKYVLTKLIVKDVVTNYIYTRPMISGGQFSLVATITATERERWEPTILGILAAAQVKK